MFQGFGELLFQIFSQDPWCWHYFPNKFCNKFESPAKTNYRQLWFEANAIPTRLSDSCWRSINSLNYFFRKYQQQAFFVFYKILEQFVFVVLTNLLENLFHIYSPG